MTSPPASDAAQPTVDTMRAAPEAGSPKRGLSRLERSAIAIVVVLTAAAAVAHYLSGFGKIGAFVLAALALAGQAWIVSLATEQLGERFGPAITGVMQSTVGNLPEFFVVLFALQARDTTVAETAILGSILVNALLVLGVILMVGSLRAKDGVMRFNTRLPNDTATLLMVSSFLIVLIALVNSSHDSAIHHIRTISVVGAALILVVYGIWLRQYLRSDQAATAGSDQAATAGSDQAATAGSDQAETAGSGGASHIPPGGSDAGNAGAGALRQPRVSLSTSVALLLTAGIASAFVSDWFVDALEPTIHQLHISQAFAGLVIVAIAGNAVENVAGIYLAHRGQADLAISVVKNSVSQIAAFLYPAMVLISLLTVSQLTFSLAPVYVGALFGTAILVWQITGDGEATPFEGAALIALFVVLATVAAFEH